MAAPARPSGFLRWAGWSQGRGSRLVKLRSDLAFQGLTALYEGHPTHDATEWRRLYSCFRHTIQVEAQGIVRAMQGCRGQ